jgi:hypothetical protein
VNRDLILASLIGTVGALLLAFGIMGFNGSAGWVHAELDKRMVALSLVAGGGILMLLEIRLMVPIFRSMASRQQGPEKAQAKAENG